MSTLDPTDWSGFRQQAHRILDDIIEYIENVRDRPVWQPIPEDVRQHFREELPRAPSDLAAVHDEFMRYILPFSAGNVHPGFMGWVHGAGTPVGVVAEMLAAGMNANLGGRDHIPVEVERQLVAWMRHLFGFPESATGLFVTGASMANLVAVLVARDAALGFETRTGGVAESGKCMVAYASTAVHGCIGKALDIAGIGSDALRLVAVDSRYRLDVGALRTAIEEDRRAGFVPSLLVGTAGTVDTGAIDDLDGLADVARAENLWFHVDGAFGALAMLSPELAPRLKGIERADSLAFDFHKWAHVPYDAGFVLVRDGTLHWQTFATSAPYLRHEGQGLAAGAPWFCDFGPELSRGFRALKTWFTLKTYGSEAIGAAIAQTCELARYLERRIGETPELELAAPVELNVVCFRYQADESHRVNTRIAIELQESGVAAPSTTVLNGKLAIRAAILNHRTVPSDIDALLNRTIALGRSLLERATASSAPPNAADSDRLSRSARESALHHIEEQLASHRAADHLRIERARLLVELGRTLEARNAYLEFLARVPSDRLALNELGMLLHSTGYRTAARTAFSEAVARHPGDPMSLVNLAHALYENHQFEAAREHYETALRSAPDYAEAHRGLSYILAEEGDAPGASWHRRKGFENSAVRVLPYRGDEPPVRLLLLISAIGGNVPALNFLDDRIFETTVIVAEFYRFNQPLPPHELIFNAIGDADLAGDALTSAQSVIALSDAPVLNPPAAVRATGRVDISTRFSRLPGVITPGTVTLARELFTAPEVTTTMLRHGLTFPLLLRSPGFHTGRHFVRVENAEALTGCVAGLPGTELIAMRYLDARGADGKVRKYRVMMIDGRLYPLHVAISSSWKIHYFTAEMAESAEHRAEDAEFLSNMPGVLGSRAVAALERIQRLLELEYAGIDFGLSKTGEVLLFEANATMVVNPPEPAEQWSYRRPAVQQIYTAFRNLLQKRARHQADA